MSSAVDTIERLLIQRKAAPHPVLQWCAGNAKSTGRIDALVARAMAFDESRRRGAAALSQASGAGRAATSRKHRMRSRALIWLSTSRPTLGGAGSESSLTNP